MVLGLALLMALAALATARTVLAPDRSINAVAAFVSLLGWHALMLLLWLLGSAGRHSVAAGDWRASRSAAWRWPAPRACRLIAARTR